MDKHELSLLNAFDFSAIEEMDPSVQDGHRVIYDREVPPTLVQHLYRYNSLAHPQVPFELRAHEFAEGPAETGSLEAIKVKLLVLGDEHSPVSLRVEVQ